MRRALAALLVLPALALAGCRGEDAAPSGPDGGVERQVQDVESTLSDIESELNGD